MIELGDATPYPSAGSAERRRLRTAAGRRSTLHVARYAHERFHARPVAFHHPEPLQAWAAATGVGEAVNGGFFTKPEFVPLGDLFIDGQARMARPFVEPWCDVRATARFDAGRLTIGSRDEFEVRDGHHLLQAGPLLVRDGEVVVDEVDPEGFSSSCHEFDNDISDGAYPRVALGTSADEVIVAVVDGRHDDDDGLTLVELAHLMVQLGAATAMNLDGGASSSLITGGARRNSPRDDTRLVLEDGLPNASAIVFEPR